MRKPVKRNRPAKVMAKARRKAESLDFLGFTFRYDRDLYGSDKTYLNVTPSKKTLKKARDAVREKTGPSKCFKPAPEVVKDINVFLRGWSNYFKFGYPRKAFRDLSHYTRGRTVTLRQNDPEGPARLQARVGSPNFSAIRDSLQRFQSYQP